MKNILYSIAISLFALPSIAQEMTMTIHADQGNQKIHKEVTVSLPSISVHVSMVVFGLERILRFQTSTDTVRMFSRH